MVSVYPELFLWHSQEEGQDHTIWKLISRDTFADFINGYHTEFIKPYKDRPAWPRELSGWKLHI